MHWHGSMLVAVAAILITALKTSDELLKALQTLPVRAEASTSVVLRNAETVHNALAVSGPIRHATVSGS